MQAQLTLLPSSSYRVMPWKNGGGTTTELYIYPPDSSFEKPFIWRTSLAQIKGSGPFSLFPAYDRIIVQLAGPPMHLLHPSSGDRRKLIPFEPYSFSGDWETSVEIEGGPALDFNLMVERSGPRAEVEVFTLAEGQEYAAVMGATSFLYLIEGQIDLIEQKTLWEAGSSLLLERHTRPLALRAMQRARWIQIDFT